MEPVVAAGKSAGVRVGQRVWVAYGGRRAFGRVFAVTSPFASDSTGFVVLLDPLSVPVICTAEWRGSQWDVADDVKS